MENSDGNSVDIISNDFKRAFVSTVYSKLCYTNYNSTVPEARAWPNFQHFCIDRSQAVVENHN
jgi:hypothetical protein